MNRTKPAPWWRSCWLWLTIGFGIVSGVLLQGSFLHVVVIMAGWFWVGGPLLLAWGGVQIYRYVRRQLNPSSLAWGGRVFAGAMLFSVLSLIVGKEVNYAKREQMKGYVERLLPLVDAHHATHGSYPLLLKDVSDIQIPILVGDSVRYSSNGERFNFIYVDNRSIMGGLAYSSSTRRWNHWD